MELFLEAARHGPRALVVEGEAGAGKTTIWEAALAGAQHDRAHPAAGTIMNDSPRFVIHVSVAIERNGRLVTVVERLDPFKQVARSARAVGAELDGPAYAVAVGLAMRRERDRGSASLVSPRAPKRRLKPGAGCSSFRRSSARR